MIKLASFDVFDTCLIRTCGTPSNMMDVLSLYVFDGDVDIIDRHRFIEARIRADKGTVSENIFDIYDSFDYQNTRLKPKSELPLIEMEVERHLLIANNSVRNTITSFRDQGVKVCFISDMYLPMPFIKEVLASNELFVDGDSIYVSNAIGARKDDGGLFEIVAKEENVSYAEWHHYGDNIISDYKKPKSLGIRSHLVKNEKTPLQKKWIEEDSGNLFKWQSSIAGLTNAMLLNMHPHFYNKALVDIVTPYCVTFAHRILKDAQKRNISRLYFFARDSYYIYVAAKAFEKNFPNIKCNYFYVSQDALYGSDANTIIEYCLQAGLASRDENVAIVDVRSTGKSVKYLNQLFVEHDIKPVFAYYYEVFCNVEYIDNVPPFYAEVDRVYEKSSNSGIRQSMFDGEKWRIFEMFFAPHNFPKTIGYQLSDGMIVPVFSEKKGSTDCIIDDVDVISNNQVNAINQFVLHYVFNGLDQYTDNIFNSIVMPTLQMFLGRPDKYYMEGLEHFQLVRDDGSVSVQFIKRIPFYQLPFRNNKNSVWRYGSIIYSLPRSIVNVWRIWHK